MNEQNFVFKFNVKILASCRTRAFIKLIDCFNRLLIFYIYVSCGVTSIELLLWPEDCVFESCCYLKMTYSLEHW